MKSIMITSVCIPPLRLAKMSCVKVSSCVLVERFFFINPCCLSKRILLASRCFEIMCPMKLEKY